MAKILGLRKFQLLKNSKFPFINISRTNVLPNTLPIPDKKLSDCEMLRNLRIAITPSYGFGSYSYKNTEASSSSFSCLAGDPRRVGITQHIRAEILDRWNTRPQPDIQREWLKNIMFN